jgi:PhnB protein
MSTRLKGKPPDFHTITPHLTVGGVEAAVAFYRDAFGAAELYRNLAPDGRSVMHCEMLCGDSRFFIHDEFPESARLSPAGLGLKQSPVTLHLYVDDVDSLYERALKAGAEVVLPLADCFWGDRYAILRDPFGHNWSIASQIEDLSPSEVNARAREFCAENPDWHSKATDES